MKEKDIRKAGDDIDSLVGAAVMMYLATRD